MDTRWRWRTIYLGILFLTTVTADTRCSSGCFGPTGSLYNFQAGTVYRYQFEGSTVTTLPGVQNDVTKLSITGTAEVNAQNQCSFVLKLSNVNVQGPDGKRYDSLSADCAKPVHFTLSNGVLEDKVCAEDDDSGASLNIKRAIISLFQSSQLKGDGSASDYESDVFGTCPTEFKFSKEGNTLSIRKTRNLNRCAHREQFSFPFLSTEYTSKSYLQSTPILEAHYEVHQNIEGGVLKSAEGEEVYDYRPLLTPESGAKVSVSVKLTLAGSSEGSIPDNANKRRTIFFEVPHEKDGAANANALLKALQDTVSEFEPSVGHTAAKNFLNLVDVLEHASKADILAIYSQVKNKDTAKHLLLDGLLYAGSADSVEAAAELLVNKEIPETNALRWYLDLNFVKHASPAALRAVMPLLDGDKVPYQAYLGVGALAGKFCREYDCESVQEFKDLINKLSAPLSAGCKVSSVEKENNLIASLKGLSNVHEVTDEVAEKLSRCAADKNVKTRIRVAALDVFHSDAGKDKLKKTATDLFKDTEEDAEVRIKAYLALVEKPCPTVADLIKDTLDKEPVNQVGSYVVSHLRNLRASTNPDKAKAKSFLGGIITKKKFPIDARKFSQNYELSYSLDALNLGASAEANRIFSQKSYIPRSVSLNLTTQLFGHSFNLLEVDARAENFDYILEKYFGPKGYFQTKETNEVIHESDSYRKHLAEKVKHRYSQSVRSKRSISKQDIDGFADKVKLGVDYEDSDLDLDLSLKLFGAEIGWFTYNDKKQDFSMDKLIDKLFDRLDKSVDKAKNVNVDFKKARTFLDATINYPTGLGFVLKVKTLGSSAVSVKVDGQLDIPALVHDPHGSELHFQVLPSGSVELNTLLAVDADCVESGVRVSANVYTNTGTDLSIRLLEGRGIDVKLGLPINKQELVTFSSDIVHVVREQGQPQTESPLRFNIKRQEHGGCFDQLSSHIGLTFCGELSYPQEGFKAFSPAYGPSKASLRIEKDQDLTIYHFKAFLQTEDNLKLEILFDTPNSNQNRKIQLYAEESINPRGYLLKFTTPWKEVSLDATFVNTDNEQSVTVKLKNNDALYSLKTGALLSGDSNRRKYEPLLEYKAPEGKSHDRFIGKKGGKGKQQHQTFGVGGAIFVDTRPGSPYRKYELKSVTVTTLQNKYTVDGTVTVDTGLIATDLLGSCDRDTYKLNSKLQKLEGKNYKASIEFTPSAYPDFGFSVKWEYSGENNKLENKLVVIHGPDLESETARFSLSQLFKYKYENVHDFDFVSKNTVSYPLLGISGKLEVDAKPKSIDVELEGAYDKSTFKVGLEAKVGTNHKLDYDVEVELKALGNSIDLSCKHEVLTEGKSKFTNSLELKPGGKFQLNAIVMYSLDKSDINNHIEAELKIPAEPKVLKLSAGVKNNRNEASSEFVVIAGNKPLIEIKGELEKTTKPSGNFKVFLPNYIDSSGNFKCDGQKFTGELDASFLKTGRKIQGKADGLITNSMYKGYAELQWDVNRNPSKKLRIETDSDYSANSIDSKNSLILNDQKTQVNVKGQLDGKLTDGTVEGDVELELPSGKVITFKLHRVAHLVPGNNQVEANWELADYATRGANPRKLTFKLASKNVDPVKLTFDGQADLTYTTPENKDIKIHVVAKKVPHGDDRWLVAGEASVTGSLVNRPINVKLDTEGSDQALQSLISPDRPYAPLQYQLQISAGDDISLNAVGKMNEHIVNEEIELKLPSDLPITHVKFTSNDVMDLYPEKGRNEYLKTNNLLQWNGDKFIRLNGEYNISSNEDEVSLKIEVESHLMSLRTLTGRIFADLADDERLGKCELDIGLTWEGKTADFETKVDFNYVKSIGHFYMKSTVPETGTFEAELKYKRLENRRGVVADLSIKANEKYVKLNHEIEVNDNSFISKTDIDSTKGKSNVYIHGERTGEAEFKVVARIENNQGKSEFNVEGNVKSPENFFLKVNADSPQLKINKFQLEMANKPAKTSGKKISFFAKSADKTHFTGHIIYNVKNDEHSTIVEGNGVLKVDDSNYPLQAKVQLYKKDDAQPDILHKLSIDVHAGKYKYDYDHKVYKHGFEAKRTFCLESKCSNAEVIVLREPTALGLVNHKTSIVLDFSAFFAFAEDFIYTETLKYNGYFFDSEVNTQYGNHKVHRHIYFKENEAGVLLELPSRTLAAEFTYIEPKGKKEGASKVEATLWLDKAKSPNEKTTLLITTDSSQSRDGGSVAGEIRFSAPGLGKDLVVKGRGEVQRESNKIIDASFEADVFAKKGQKLVAEWKVLRTKNEGGVNIKDNFHASSKGLGWDVGMEGELSFTKSSLSWISKAHYLDSKKTKKEGIAKLEVSESKFVYLVKIPEATLIDLDYKLTSNSIIGDINFVGNEYKEKLDLNNRKKYTFEFTRDQKKEVLDIEFGYAAGQIIELSGSYNHKSFLSYAVALDELNFLKTKYSYDVDVLKALTQTYQEEIVHVAQDSSNVAKAAFERVSIDAADFSEDVRKALPNFKPVLDAYEKELKEIREEIANNQHVKEASESLRNLLSVPLQQLTKILEEAAEALKSTLDVLNDAWQKTNESVKKLIPKLKESYEKIFGAMVDLFADTLKFAANMFSNILDNIKEYEEEIKELITTITEFVQDIGKLFAKSFDDIRKEVEDFTRLLYEQLKALPQFEILKEKLEELKQYKIPDQAWSVYEEVTTGLEQSMPTDELRLFISKAADYIEKLLKGQPVDSIHELEDLYNSLKAAVRSVIVMVSSAVEDEQYFKPSGPVPLPAITFWEAPVGAVRFSFLSWLQSTDLPSWSDLYYTYRPTLNPLDYFPPYRGAGLLVHNSEFFTFDNRHYTFKGTCGYLLAQDFVDGNFSVAVNLEGGKVKSLHISDRDNIVEARSDGTVYVNGAQSEYPLHQGDLYGWRKYHSVNFASAAGLIVHCQPSLEVCSFQISGFYFGKTRGLLGTLNNEQYDEFTVPSGHVAKTTSEFVNTWKTSSSCGDVPDSGPLTQTHTEQCTKLFTTDSPFRKCFTYVNPSAFRDACDHVVNEAQGPTKQEAACIVAATYVGTARLEGCQLTLPNECGQCKVGSNNVQVGDSVSVKIPARSADIVFAVEQVKENEEVFSSLIVPLVSTLTNDFKEKGITDVKFALIGFGGPKQKWVQHYTTDGKVEFTGKTKNIDFEKKPEATKVNAYHAKLQAIADQINVEIGNTQMVQAIKEASEYPFRPESVKSIVAVLANPCQKSIFPVSLQQFRMVLNRIYHIGAGVKVNVITQIKDLALEGKDAKAAANIVGFDDEAVYTQNEAKRKVLRGDEEAFKSLKYSDDICIDYAQSVGGAVFNSDNFVSGKPGFRKNFLNVVSTKVVEDLTSEELHKECTCEYKMGLVPVTRCMVVGRKEKEQLRQTKGAGTKG